MKFLIVFLLIAGILFAQETSLLKEMQLKSELLDKSAENIPTKLNVVHGPVNDSTYVVGPGDIFTLALLGNVVEEEHEITVNPEGTLVIPKMGVVSTNCTLVELRKRVVTLVKSKTKSVDIIFQLKDVKSSIITITGQVLHPGSYTFNSTVRLSEVITKAYTNKTDEQVFSYNASLRNVKILTTDGRTITVDFQDYLLNGTSVNNPYIFSGYEIFVPTRTNVDIISGAVARPGVYDHRAQTVSDFITFTGGFLPNADSSNISVISYQKDGKTLETKKLSFSECHNKILQPDDRIIVGSIPFFHEQANVRLVGRVKNPGSYMVPKGSLIKDLFTLAGGLLADADSSTCYLSREDFFSNYTNGDYKTKLIENQVSNPAVLALRLNKSDDEYNGGLDYPLTDGDVITVPKKTANVSVVGRVEKPGIYDHNPEMAWKDYVNRAGGFDKAAYTGKVKVFKRALGAWVSATSNVSIEPGDIILVPELPPEYYWNKIKDAITITSGIVSIVVTVLVLSGK